jgi:hypothetical protein
MPMRGRPARRDQQRFAPSLIVVGSLVAVGLIVAGVLFLGVNRGDEPDGLVATTVVPGETAAPAGTAAPVGSTASAAAPAPVVTDVAIATVQAWDPDGDNGAENDAQAGLALADGSESTSWPTECYQNKYLGGKRGVGLILGLTAASAGTLGVDALNAPYQIEIYAATGPTPPTDLTGWQQIGDRQSAAQPGRIEVRVDLAATFVMVWLKELGRDEACTENNPYRGRLGEISYRP